MEASSNFAKIGDIFVSSWGYSMTLVSWYQVVRFTPKKAVLRELNAKIVDGDGFAGQCMPVFEIQSTKDTKFISKTITENGIKINNYEYARKWDGEPMHFNHLD